jgi:hypothetical protein
MYSNRIKKKINKNRRTIRHRRIRKQIAGGNIKVTTKKETKKKIKIKKKKKTKKKKKIPKKVTTEILDAQISKLVDAKIAEILDAKMDKTSELLDEKTDKISEIFDSKTEQSGSTTNIEAFEKKTEISGSGVFCYMPYTSLDQENKSIFKIDLAMDDIDSKTEELKKFYPTGFFVIAELFNPLLDIEFDKEQHYRNIIAFLVEFIIKEGGETKPEYETGWIYCSEETIHNSFKDAKIKFGGECKQFGLVGRNEKTLKTSEVKNTEAPQFVGKVVYHT